MSADVISKAARIGYAIQYTYKDGKTALMGASHAPVAFYNRRDEAMYAKRVNSVNWDWKRMKIVKVKFFMPEVIAAKAKGEAP